MTEVSKQRKCMWIYQCGLCIYAVCFTDLAGGEKAGFLWLTIQRGNAAVLCRIPRGANLIDFKVIILSIIVVINKVI